MPKINEDIVAAVIVRDSNKQQQDDSSSEVEMSDTNGGGQLNGDADTTTTTTINSNSNEQPVTKRQRIDGLNVYNDGSFPSSDKLAVLPVSQGTTVATTTNTSPSPPPGDNNNSGAVDETDRALHLHHSRQQQSLLDSSNTSLTPNSPEFHLKSAASTTYASSSSNSSLASFPDLERAVSHENLVDIEIMQFQNSLTKQCLCGVSERVLRRPFESHYVYQTTTTTTMRHDRTSMRRIAPLSEWPTPKLVHLLSNLQLVFDVYLKQNTKGQICCRIMDVCDALIRNEQNLIDEIIDLCEYDNNFVQFLAGRVLSSFLIIAKDTMTHDNWMKKLIDNLFSFEHINYASARKINFSLDIIKRIVEWKDVEVHPLDGLAEDGEEDEEGEGEGGASQHRLPLPPLENNYFAAFYNEEMVRNSSSSSSQREPTHPPQNPQPHVPGQCEIIHLTDSESFDTSNLKCIAIKNLENKWPALVKNMSTLILSNRNTTFAENCVLTFLNLWESIISVHTNLSIVETLPFYAQLDKFEMLLLNDHLPCTIYKQMLTLFNEALCYGSTLALQDMLPEETCNLAHQIVRHVKDHRILDGLPRVRPENEVSFIGHRGDTVTYERTSFVEAEVGSGGLSSVGGSSVSTVGGHGVDDSLGMDKTLLQKMVLLVLKSVAVTVKEIRSDSSDSSIDSSDYEAFQDMVLIERSIRDVLKKLENFMKNTLEFHPESHFSKILIHLFEDQDDYLIEAMVCTLDVTVGISFRNNAFPELVTMLSPVLTFLEFLRTISNSADLLLDLLVSNETCFLLYLLRFLKYVRFNWSLFTASCRNSDTGVNCLDDTMSVLIRLRLQISRLVSRSLYPYDISPVLRLLESCEGMYEGNELS